MKAWQYMSPNLIHKLSVYEFEQKSTIQFGELQTYE